MSSKPSEPFEIHILNSLKEYNVVVTCSCCDTTGAHYLNIDKSMNAIPTDTEYVYPWFIRQGRRVLGYNEDIKKVKGFLRCNSKMKINGQGGKKYKLEVSIHDPTSYSIMLGKGTELEWVFNTEEPNTLKFIIEKHKEKDDTYRLLVNCNSKPEYLNIKNVHIKELPKNYFKSI